MRVIIAHGSVTRWDAIGNDILGMVDILRDEGFQIKIVAEHFHDSINMELRLNIDDATQFPSDILIYHHSIYWPLGERFFNVFKGYKILRYHNITPPHFFAGISNKYYLSTFQGRLQTKRLVEMADYFLSDSNFNEKELLELGASTERSSVVAPFNALNRYDAIMEDEQITRNLVAAKNIVKVLSVGRIAPNKGYHHIIQVANQYVKMFDSNVRFYCVGSFDNELAPYTSQLNEMIQRFGLQDIVIFVGAVSMEVLKSYYSNCDIFLHLSEHEGFGVPLVEAQHFGLPLIAYGGSAVREICGLNQLIFDDMDYVRIACAIHVVQANGQSHQLIEFGHDNLKQYHATVPHFKFLCHGWTGLTSG